jgi:hypothetical protein
MRIRTVETAPATCSLRPRCARRTTAAPTSTPSTCSIGATTVDEYRRNIEKDAALERRFQPVLIPEPSVEETIQILEGLRDSYEAHHQVRFTDEALVAAAALSDRYVSDRFLPDKAIDCVVRCRRSWTTVWPRCCSTGRSSRATRSWPTSALTGTSMWRWRVRGRRMARLSRPRVATTRSAAASAGRRVKVRND